MKRTNTGRNEKTPEGRRRSILLVCSERAYGLARVDADLYERAAAQYGQKSLLVERLARWLYEAEVYIEAQHGNPAARVVREREVKVTAKGVRRSHGRRVSWRGFFGKSRDRVLDDMLRYVIDARLVAPELGRGSKDHHLGGEILHAMRAEPAAPSADTSVANCAMNEGQK